MKHDVKKIGYYEGIFDKYKADSNLDNWCYEFPELMWGLGYEMDCCQSFEKYVPSSKLKLKDPKNNRERKRNALYLLEHVDRQIVGNY